MQRALEEMRIDGVTTTIPFHQKLMRDRAFVGGGMHTRYIEQVFLRRRFIVGAAERQTGRGARGDSPCKRWTRSPSIGCAFR